MTKHKFGEWNIWNGGNRPVWVGKKIQIQTRGMTRREAEGFPPTVPTGLQIVDGKPDCDSIRMEAIR